MERYKCKLCFKIFINGKALGGHMRSHLMNLPISEERRLNRPKDLKPSEETSSSSSDPEFPVVAGSSEVLQDRESETESSKNPIRRRSKRIRKFQSRSKFEARGGELKKTVEFSKVSESWTEQEPVSSSISDVTTEEDVAFCLMMMSRDKWKQRKKPEMAKSADEEETEEEPEEDEEETDESEGKFACETCTKTFRSYQALGGHRASHRRNQAPPEEAVPVARGPSPPEILTSATVRGECKVVHECPYCFRVFGSGQALGGHKRTHAAIYGSVTAAVPVSNKVKSSAIDLNLPASVEEVEGSQVKYAAEYYKY